MSIPILIHPETLSAAATLPPRRAQELWTLLDMYQRGEEAQASAPLIALWTMIKSQLDRDRDNYLTSRQRRIEAGRKGGEAKKGKKKAMPSNAKQCLAMLSNAKLPIPIPIPNPIPIPPIPAGSPDQKTVSNDTVSSEPCATNVATMTRSTRNAAPEKLYFDYIGDRKIHNISPEQLRYWTEAYPGIDVPDAIRKAECWLDANPKNRKSDVKRFLVNWLTRQQDRARAPQPARSYVSFQEQERDRLARRAEELRIAREQREREGREIYE